ncbi:MAG: MFS transporter [Kofleriaceae bacterium]
MPTPSTSWRRVAFLLFVIGWGANHFGALLLVYRSTLALDPAVPQLVFGIYALGLVPGLLLSGPLSDRFGRRALVLPAAVLALVASVVLGLGGDHVGLLLVGRLLYGIGCGAVMNPGAVWVLELSADAVAGGGARRATVALSSGFGFGPLITGLLAQYAPYPVVLPYVVHVAVLIVAIVIASTTPGGRPAPGPRRPLLSVGIDRTNRRGFLLGVVWMAPFVFAFPILVFAALPAMLGPDVLGAAPIAYIGVLGAVTLGAGILAQPVTRRFDPTVSARVGLALGALGCALGAYVVYTQASELLLVVAVVLGAGYGICMTSGLRNVEILAKPETRGALTGLYYVLTYIGFSVPYLLAVASRSIAPTFALLGVAALSGLAAIVLRRVQ